MKYIQTNYIDNRALYRLDTLMSSKDRGFDCMQTHGIKTIKY